MHLYRVECYWCCSKNVLHKIVWRRLTLTSKVCEVKVTQTKSKSLYNMYVLHKSNCAQLHT